MADTAVGRVSEDGLWRWDGKGWVHVTQVDVPCGRCEAIVSVGERKNDFKCANGHKQDFISCTMCKATFQRPSEHRDYAVRCPHCSHSSQYVSNVSAWTWAGDQLTRGLWPLSGSGTVDRDRRVIRGFPLAASGGSSIANGSSCLIDFSDEGIGIKASDGQQAFVPYEQVQALQVTGSTKSSGGGVIGGGFGVEGAVEGMLAASGINALTTRTSVYSVLRIAARTAQYVFVSHTVDSNALNMLLTPGKPRVRMAQAQHASAPPPHAPSSIADELTKLARLRDEGVLSDAEFSAAKSRVLGSL